MRARAKKSMMHLPILGASNAKRFSSVPTLSSPVGVCSLPSWRRETGYRRLTGSAIMSPLAA
jgi:hypothetical protein